MLNFRLESAGLAGGLGVCDGLNSAFVDIDIEDLTTSAKDGEPLATDTLIRCDWDSNLASFPLKSSMVDLRFVILSK